MNVFIESTLNGVATCHLELNTAPNATVDSLISAFCIDKGIRQRPQYVLKTQQNVLLDNAKTLQSYGILSGDILYLTTRNEDQHIFGFHNWWLLAGVALIIGILGIIIVTVLFVMNGEAPSNYGIVFDAGSSHTSMIIYKWDGEKANGTGQVTQFHRCDVNGSGINNYAKTPEKAGQSLEHCLDEAKQQIPEDHHKISHVYLGATAGMRLLNISNPENATEVMESINKTLATSGFDFSANQSRIITGQEEGVFGWITVNYLSYRLGPAFHEKTIGALDLGGASTQISFVPKSSLFQECKEDCYLNLRLYGQKYHVFSRSYMCFGMNEIERRFHFELANESQNETSINNPCAQTGINYNMSTDLIFNHLCTLNISVNSTKNLTFVGNYDAFECEARISDLLNLTICCQNYKYCLNDTIIPKRVGEFMSFSGFAYIMEDLNLTNVKSLNTVKEKINHFCNASTKEMIYFLSYTISKEFLSDLCFKAKYVLLLLTNVYKFNTDDRWKHLSFVNTINKVNVGWSLGFMTNATNLIPEEEAIEMLELPVFVLLVIVFVAFIITAILIGYQAWKQKKRTTSYQRFSQYGAI